MQRQQSYASNEQAVQKMIEQSLFTSYLAYEIIPSSNYVLFARRTLWYTSEVSYIESFVLKPIHTLFDQVRLNKNEFLHFFGNAQVTCLSEDEWQVTFMHSLANHSHLSKEAAIENFKTLRAQLEANIIQYENGKDVTQAYFREQCASHCKQQDVDFLIESIMKHFSGVQHLKFVDFEVPHSFYAQNLDTFPILGIRRAVFGVQKELSFDFYGMSLKFAEIEVFAYGVSERSEQSTESKTQNKDDTVYRQHFNRKVFTLIIGLRKQEQYENEDQQQQQQQKQKYAVLKIFPEEKLDSESVGGAIKKLMQKSYSEVFSAEQYFGFFSEEKEHKFIESDRKLLVSDIQALSQKFAFGSVLRAYRKDKFIFHACVYLGADLVIHVCLQQSDLTQKGQIFQFDTFERFLGDSDQIRETVFHHPPYTRAELIDKAIKFNSEQYQYNLASLNCEHLAYDLAIGFKVSLQLEQNFLKRVVANFVGNQFKISQQQ